MKRLIVGAAMALCLATLGTAAYAEVPTVESVQQEVQRGNYAHAEAMMQEVVGAKPKSAKAHYIYAEILARNGRFDVAAREARSARELDPAIGFTQPDKFAAFEQLLQREQGRAAENAGRQSNAAATTVPAERAAPVSSGVPGWVWMLGGLAVVVVLFKMFTSRAGAPNAGVAPMQQPNVGGPGYGGGYGVNQGYAPMGGMQPGRPGGGMLGTGIAAAGGFAAGMLADDLLRGRHDASAATAGDVRGGDVGAAGGNQYAADLEQRQVDFGSGGNWDDNASGGSVDTGSSSDDGSGW